MEIRDYLHAIRRLLWLPLMLPLVAGMATGVLLVRQPSTFQADATVIVPAVSAHGFSTSAVAQYIATFKDVLISSPVVSKVSAKTGVTPKELVTGLSATTISASSNIIHVTFIGHNKNNVTTVVHEATLDTLDVVAQPQLAQAQNAVAAATTQLSAANAAITQFTADTGILNPNDAFRTKQAELSQLLLQLQQANLAGDTTRAKVLTTVITTRQSELASLATHVAEYTTLADAKQSALSVRDHSAQQLASAQALLASNHDPNTISVVDTGKISKLAEVLKFTAIAAAVALILALAFILLLELLRARRQAPVPMTKAAALAAPPAHPAVAAHAAPNPTAVPSRQPALAGASNGNGHTTNGHNVSTGSNGHHTESGAVAEPSVHQHR